MPKMIFINLPVKDLALSTSFYQAIGFEKNEAFSDEKASCMVWSETIYVMLLSQPFYETFTAKQIADAKATSGVLLCLTFDDKAGVDAIHQSALSSGGLEARAIEDKGFMYGGAFDDPDGHGWETVWMDPAAVEGGVPDA